FTALTWIRTRTSPDAGSGLGRSPTCRTSSGAPVRSNQAARMAHPTPMPEIRHVRANGLEFAYLEEGKGPLVLLLHGFPDTAHTWDDLRPKLAARGFRAVSPWTRGYAPTEVPARDADLETLARDALALIEALGEKKAILVGH